MNLSLTGEEKVNLAFEGLRHTANHLQYIRLRMRELARTGPDGDLELTCSRLEAHPNRPYAAQLLEEHRELTDSYEAAAALYKQVRVEHRNPVLA